MSRLLSLVILSMVLALTHSSGARAQQALPFADDPVGFIGHGTLFDRNGRPITPDVATLESISDYYIKALRERLTEGERQSFDEQRNKLFKDNALDRRNGLEAKSRMIEWLLKRAGDLPDGSISGKASLVRQLLQYEDPVTRDKAIQLLPDLGQRLGTAGFGNIRLFSSMNFGAAYRAECQANGVPIPPDIGSSAWTLSTLGGRNKFLSSPGSPPPPDVEPMQLFISTGAQVYIYRSTAPEGMCIALPRSANPGAGSGNTIDLDGVICVGKVTSKVCFWDNQAPDGPGQPGPAVPFSEGTVTPLSGFAGGADLLGGSGGICTGCHSGENPYTFHPGTILSSNAFPSYPSMPDNWYDPLVHPNWPQNAGPIDQSLVPGACAGCHSRTGGAGRFPLLSRTIENGAPLSPDRTEYCSVVLRNAVNRTMPPSAPGSLAGNAAVQAFQDLCNRAAAPIARIESTTLDFGEVELGFTFSKGLVIHNDGDAPLTGSVTVQGSADPAIWTDIGVAGAFTLNPGDPPMVLRQEFHPVAVGVQTMQLRVATNDPAVASTTVNLTGNGITPRPLDSVLVLDRSGSMADPAGDSNKIDAMRSAALLYSDLLRFDALSLTGDRLGFVKYNQANQEYMPLSVMDAARKSVIASNVLSTGAITDLSRLQPDGTTGIGGAMQRGANMLSGSGTDRNIALVIMTDGAENQAPFIADVKDGIAAANPRLKMYSLGLGFAIEPAKLQSITNVSNGYHQVTDQLTGPSLFDLESFYFKIFTSAAGLSTVVDPTVIVDLSTLAPTTIERARIVTSDRSATFVVLDDPALRGFYELEFISPKGVVIQPGTSIGGVPIQEFRNLNHRIFRIIFPDPSQASEYAGDWVLQLKPNGKWSPENAKRALAESTVDYSGNLQPVGGFVPIGFMAAVMTDYRMDVTATATTYLPGDTVKVTARLTDRGWPSTNGRVMVRVTLADGSTQGLQLADDGQGADSVASDAVWSGTFNDTSRAGSYKFLFQAVGHNMRGELTPREDQRFVTLKPLERTPKDPHDPNGHCPNKCLEKCVKECKQ